jgi:hypothetical protein
VRYHPKRVKRVGYYRPMRRSRSHLVALVTLAAALAFFSASAGSVGASTPKATVAVTGADPMTVKGTGFLPRERVTVRLTVGQDSFARSPRAGARGRFAVQFDAASAIECLTSAIMITTVVATGNRSGRTARARIRWVAIPPPCGYAPQP